MNDANKQILALAHDGLSAEDISSMLGYDVDAVTMVLMTVAPKALKENLEKESVSQEDLDKKFMALENKALFVISELMTRSEDDGVKAKLAMYVSDQRLGRFKTARTTQVTNIIQVQKDVMRVKQMYGQGAIDVDSSVAA